MSSSVEVFTPKNPHFPSPVKDQVEIEAPLKQDESPKKPFIQVALMVGIPVMMLVMMILMFTVGGRSNPMMFMFGGMMMLSMTAGLVMQFTGGDQANVNGDRQNYVLMLGKNRNKAHAIGRSQHAIQTHFYPNPHNLANLVRLRDASMWTARPDESAEVSNTTLELGDEQKTWEDSGQSGSPYMKARVGNGLIELSPSVRVRQDESVAPEQLEPVTYQASVNFLATQNVVPNSPVAVSLSDMPAVGLRGHVPYRYDLVRGIVMSLTYNHSPDRLMVGVVSASDDEWDWIKWLPHNANTFIEPDAAGYRTLRWSAFTEAVRDLKQVEDVLRQDTTRVLVIVDLPTTSLRYPPGIMQVENVTFLIVRSQDDEAVTKKRSNRFHISNEYVSDRMFSAYDQIEAAKVDVVPRYLAENYARLMAPLRTPNFRKRERATASENEVQVRDAPRMLESLGINDLDTVDLPARWRETDQTETFSVPLGFAVERNPRTKEYQPTGGLVHLDMVQIESDGTGPHGMLSGGTGTGKSFLMKAFVLMLCATYSPRKLNIITADFKGGSAFSDLGHLPHFQASLSNLSGAMDMVDRSYDVLEGEKHRRFELFDRYGVEDIFAYRQMQRSRPDMPDTPDLLFIADEFQEFIRDHPEYKKLFDSLASVGRSLGLHLLLASQFIDQTMVGQSVVSNTNYGVSLKVASGAHSSFVIGSSDAANLPPNRVGILHRTKLQDTILEHFQGFDHSAPYTRRSVAETSAISPGGERQVIDATLTEFGLSSFAEHADGDISTDEGFEQAAVASETGKNEFQALLDMVTEQSRGYTETYTMWTRPMSVPLSLSGMEDEDFAAPDRQDIVIRLGDVDVPFEHKRVPMNLTLSPSTGNVAVVGETGTGRSTTIKAMIASSALRYTGQHLSWMIYDHAGTSLSAMENFPNVSAYSTRDDDTWSRIKGEINRVLEVRQRAFATHRFSTVNEYLHRRRDLGITGDVHGHIVLVIDGLQEWAESIKLQDVPLGMLTHWLEVGPRHGVYIVGTAQDANKIVPSSRLDKFTTGIRHWVGNRMEAFKAPSAAAQGDFTKVLNGIPLNDPGRVIDASQVNAQGHTMYLHGRVLLPIQQEIEPVSYSLGNVPRYDLRKDFSPEIIELGNAITASGIGKFAAAKLETVGTNIELRSVMNAVNPEVRSLPQRARPIPYGVDTATNTVAALDPAIVPTFGHGLMRYLAVCGGARSGRTTTVRSLMASTAQMYSPDEARFIVLDGTGSLADDVREYTEQGYMKSTSYAMDRDQARTLMEQLQALIADRAPDTDELRVNSQMRTERTYFSGPEMFIFIDNAEAFLSRSSMPGPAGVEEMVQTLPSYDVGVRMAFVLGTNVPTYASANKAVQRLVEEFDLYFLLHSGRSTGAITMGTQTRFKTLPPGRAQLFHPTHHSGSDVPVVQVATPD